MDILTQVTEENYKYYEGILPKSVKEYFESDQSNIMIGIESFGAAAGAIVLRLDGRAATIVWLGLLPEYRGMGIMNNMFVEMLQILENVGVTRLITIIHKDTDERYKRLISGYEFEYRKIGMVTWNSTLAELRKVKVLGAKATHCIGLYDAETTEIKKLNSDITNKKVAYVNLPIAASDYEKCSSLYIKNADPKAAMLIKKIENELHIAYLYSKENQPEALIEVMANSLEHTKDDYDDDTPVSADVINASLVSMIEKLDVGTLEHSVQGTLRLA